MMGLWSHWEVIPSTLRTSWWVRINRHQNRSTLALSQSWMAMANTWSIASFCKRPITQRASKRTPANCSHNLETSTVRSRLLTSPASKRSSSVSSATTIPLWSTRIRARPAIPVWWSKCPTRETIILRYSTAAMEDMLEIQESWGKILVQSQAAILKDKANHRQLTIKLIRTRAKENSSRHWILKTIKTK